MPYGAWVDELPTGLFLAVHVAAFVCTLHRRDMDGTVVVR